MTDAEPLQILASGPVTTVTKANGDSVIAVSAHIIAARIRFYPLLIKTPHQVLLLKCSQRISLPPAFGQHQATAHLQALRPLQTNQWALILTTCNFPSPLTVTSALSPFHLLKPATTARRILHQPLNSPRASVITTSARSATTISSKSGA